MAALRSGRSGRTVWRRRPGGRTIPDRARTVADHLLVEGLAVI